MVHHSAKIVILLLVFECVVQLPLGLNLLLGRMPNFYCEYEVLMKSVAFNNVEIFLEQAIRIKIKSLNYEEYTAEIKTADAQESFEKGVIVLVTGCLTGKDNVGRKFTQTFFLAPQENGYFVLNDVFRYIEDNESSQSNNVPVNIIDESAPEAALIAEPGGHNISLLAYRFICFSLHFPIALMFDCRTYSHS